MTDETMMLADEQQTAIEPEANEPDLPEAETPEEPVNLEGDEGETETDEDNPDGDGEGSDDAAQFVEIEYNGKTYQVPPELENAIMKDRDYTQKSQANAEMKRQLETRMQEIDRMASVSQEEMSIKAHLMGIDERLQQYTNLDWQRLEAEDPIGAQSHWRQYQMLKDNHAQAVGALQQKAQERTAFSEQETARRLQETTKYAQQNIKGWTPEVDAKVTRFAMEELGFDQATLRNALSPQVYRTLHLAEIGFQALARQQGAKPVPTVKAKPLQKVNAKANPAAKRSLAEMDMDEYAATRMKQMGYR